MKNRIAYLLTTWLLTIVIFVIAKVAFMLSYHAENPFVVSDVLDVIKHGMSLDASMALYLICLPLLMMMISSWWRLSYWILNIYWFLISAAMALAFVADTSLYEFWHFKLDASCLGYLEQPTEAMASVSTGYLLMRLLEWLVVAVLCSCAYFMVTYYFLRKEEGKVQWRKALAETVFYLLIIPCLVIGIRGGIGESTTNIGQAYYSPNQFLNHSAVNPLFSFLASMDKSGDYMTSYDYYGDDECRQLTDGLFFTSSELTDTLLTTTRPNIVLIVMESCGGQFTEMGGHSEITPRLNSLFREGVFFSECYANSWRTDKGVVSILSGYPAFPVTSVMKIPEKSRKMPSIARSLQAEGYACSFFYGGDINFTNMRSYVMSTGYETLKWRNDYSTADQRTSQWGVRDDIMFRSLLQDIQSEKSERWMKTLLTLSSHEPWDVPTKVLDDKVYNSFYYLDQCIGQFIDSLKQTQAWKNTLVVILPDHGYRYKGIDERTRLYNHIPMVWLGGAVKASRRIDKVCSQSDLAATLLGQMAIRHDDYAFSRDVLSTQYQYPVAYHTYNNGVTVIDSTGFMAYDLDAQCMTASEGPDTERQLRLARALLQLTSNDLIQK